MKSLQEFKLNVIEEEKQDYSKFDTLVRAGLANKSQINRLHKILDKMGEDKPVFNQQDRQIMQDLFNKMVDLVTNNKQIFQQTRRAVREELEEGVLDTSDYKVGPSGRKVRAHRIKVGDTAYGVEPKETKEEVEIIEESLKGDPPYTLVLKRKAIRLYPNDTKIALYYNERLKKYFSIPYSDTEKIDAPVTAESFEQKFSKGIVEHITGETTVIDKNIIDSLLKVYNELNEENKLKFQTLVEASPVGLKKMYEFANKQK